MLRDVRLRLLPGVGRPLFAALPHRVQGHRARDHDPGPGVLRGGDAPLLERGRTARRSRRTSARDARRSAILGLSMILAFVFLDSFPPMAVAVFVAGATLASISPVSLALQGVVTPKHEYSRLELDLQRVLRGGHAPRAADLERDLPAPRRRGDALPPRRALARRSSSSRRSSRPTTPRMRARGLQPATLETSERGRPSPRDARSSR